MPRASGGDGGRLPLATGGCGLVGTSPGVGRATSPGLRRKLAQATTPQRRGPLAWKSSTTFPGGAPGRPDGKAPQSDVRNALPGAGETIGAASGRHQCRFPGQALPQEPLRARAVALIGERRSPIAAGDADGPLRRGGQSSDPSWGATPRDRPLPVARNQDGCPLAAAFTDAAPRIALAVTWGF